MLHSSTSSHIWLFEQGNYDSLCKHIAQTDWYATHDDDIDMWLKNFTDYLLSICTQFIPNKIVIVKVFHP